MSLKLSIARCGLAAALVAAACGVAAQPAPAEQPDFDAPLAPEEIEKRLGYAAGYSFGRQLSAQMPVEVPLDTVREGLRDGMEGRASAYDQNQLRHAQVQMMALVQERQRALTDRLFAELEAQGMERTDSGIWYEVLEAGEGPSPDAQDTVVAHYTGRLLDGTVFDSSRERGQPARFPLTGVIQGWQEILPRMQEGGRWRVVIPYELAYGAQGRPPTIPPMAALEFDIELVSVEAAQGEGQ